MYAHIARGDRALGSHIVFAPVLDVFTDARFGRLQEGFGEEPAHAAAFARAAVHGLQGEGVSGGGGGQAGGCWRRALPADKVLAVGKHFVGYGAPEGGMNGAPAALSERGLLEEHPRPWRAFAAAGGSSAMAAHHVALGVPCHASRRLLRGLLRSELGICGPVFSDCNDVGGLVAYRVAHNLSDAASLALEAGVDVDLQCGRGCGRGGRDAELADSGGECGAFRRLSGRGGVTYL